MPDPANTSFIPKRNPAKKSSHSNSPKVFIGTLIVQILFFAVLIASLGVFAYERKLTSDIDKEVIALNNAISSFSEEDMQKIINIDTRLAQAKNRLAHTASITSLFAAIEAATVESIKIKSLELNRPDDTSLTIESEMIADSFDSVLFQRGVLKRDSKLVVTDISDVALQGSVIETKDKIIKKQNVEPEDVTVSFKAELSVNTNLIPHTPTNAQNNLSSSEIDTGMSSSSGIINSTESESLPTNDAEQSAN